MEQYKQTIEDANELVGKPEPKVVEYNEPDSIGHLIAMNKKMTNIYSGTVDPVTIAERRAKNKRAAKSRRANRKHK